jgi:hypothetical protein
MNEELEVGQGQVNEAEVTGPEQTNSPAEETAQQTVSEESNSDEKGNHKAYTKEEQAAYSFRKQLGKQRAKYENQYGQLQQQYNTLLERLEKLEHPEKYAPLNRGQFQDDDSYIDALVQQRFENMWKAKMEEAEKAYSEQTKQDKELNAYRTRADENVKKLFKTPEAEKQYRDAIATALQNGLGELVDSDKETSMYIMRSELGPKILYELATNPKTVEDLFNDNVTDMDRQFKIRELENRLRTEMTKPALPVVGKPGIQAEAKSGSIFDSDDSVLAYLRTH